MDELATAQREAQKMPETDDPASSNKQENIKIVDPSINWDEINLNNPHKGY